MNWISVNERLPNTYDDVLLWGKLSRIQPTGIKPPEKGSVWHFGDESLRRNGHQ